MAKSDTELHHEDHLTSAPDVARVGDVAHRRGHRILAALLLVIGALLTPVTITTLFLHTQITDTGRYVQTVEPLASDPAVQAYVADTITNRLFTDTDVAAYVRQVLPERAQPLVGPLTSALKSFTHEATLRVLESKQFQTVWVAANRAAHAQLVNVLTGSKSSSGAIQSSNGAVTVDLSAIGTEVKKSLESTGIKAFSKIPTDKIAGKITVFQSKDLYRARRAVGFLDRMAFVLPILVLGCLGGAILLSRNRRRGFIAAAIAFMLGALLLAVGLATGRGIYLDAATKGGLPRDAAAPVYDTLVRMLHTSLRAVLAFSIVVVLAAFLSGPSRLAVAFRDRVRRSASWLGGESDRAGWGWLGASGFVEHHKRVLRIAIAVVAFAVLVLWNRPTPMVVFWIGVGTLLVLAIVEFFGRDAPRRVESKLLPSAGKQ
jgi:hypothetical protein